MHIWIVSFSSETEWLAWSGMMQILKTYSPRHPPPPPHTKSLGWLTLASERGPRQDSTIFALSPFNTKFSRSQRKDFLKVGIAFIYCTWAVPCRDCRKEVCHLWCPDKLAPSYVHLQTKGVSVTQEEVNLSFLAQAGHVLLLLSVCFNTGLSENLGWKRF